MKERFRSKYIDIPNEPLYPFGYGLSYTEFSIGLVELDKEIIKKDTSITAKVQVKNNGQCARTQVVQLYICDVAASVVRPVKELKGFKKVELKPGEEATVEFVIDETMLRFLRADGTVGSEPGEFKVWIGDNSRTENEARFRLGE